MEKTTIVRQGISRNLMQKIVNKAKKNKYEFISVNPSKKSGLHDVVISKKMWDNDVKRLFELGRNFVPTRNKGVTMSKKSEAANTFLTFPQKNLTENQTNDFLSDIVSSCDEIWWTSAYLTNWPISKNCIPKRSCSLFNIVVGSDFGITRKVALKDLLTWSQKTIANVYINQAPGFHPKAILWKNANKYFACIGSSNLSVAAWSSNVELNVIVNINKIEYEQLTNWFQDAVIGDSSFLDMQWINSYNESQRKPNKHKNAIMDLNQRIHKLNNVDLSFPRNQHKVYIKNRSKFINLVNSCAKGSILNSVFYSSMWKLLYGSWYGSPIWKINCKKADWKQTCKALENIIAATKSDRDRIVKESIDTLALKSNPSRGAWLSEILCHHFPEEYPLINKPIKSWLRKNFNLKINSIPDGNTYIKVSKLMRQVLNENNDKFNGLGELDHVIWEKTRKE